MRFRKTGADIDWANQMNGLFWPSRAAYLVHAAERAGIFRGLAGGPAPADALARALGLDAAMTEKVLIALAAMGLAARAGQAWTLTPKAGATLLPDAPLYQGNALAHSAQVSGFWTDLASALRGEKGGWAFAPEGRPTIRSYRDFLLAMHNMAMAGRAAELADRVDLAGCRTLTDVGGGPATYAMALCERYPDLRATVLDLPEAVAIAREVIERCGMADRVAARAGDWDADDFGRASDAVLLSNVMHGPSSGAEMKLRKAHRALVAGGRLVVQDFLLNEEKTGPLIPALFNVMVGAFAVTELVDRVTAAGFGGVRLSPMPETVGTTVLTARK